MSDHNIVCFTVFNWRYPAHWIIVLLQLLTGQKYWWIAHCAPLIRTTYGQSTVEIRLTRSYLKQYEPDEYRELYFPAFNVTPERTAYLLCSKHFLNCADITFRMANVKLTRYPTPARAYEFALRYTLSHCSNRTSRGVSNSASNVAIPTPNYQGDHSGDVRYVPHV